jgi:hypothetical protein
VICTAGTCAGAGESPAARETEVKKIVQLRRTRDMADSWKEDLSGTRPIRAIAPRQELRAGVRRKLRVL